MQASSVRRSLNDALASAGIKIDVDLTPHSFRRTVATMLAREISDGAAASRLGHTALHLASIAPEVQLLFQGVKRIAALSGHKR